MCKIRDEARRLKREIIARANLITSEGKLGERLDAVVQSGRFSYISPGIRSILCSLNDEQDEVTVANCVFERPKDGESVTMDVHHHDRLEHVFVVFGEIEEVVSSTKLQEGMSITIAPNTPHGWRSAAGCMLTISWRPAYGSV